MAHDLDKDIEETTQGPIEEKSGPKESNTALSDLSWKYKLLIITCILTLSGKLSFILLSLIELESKTVS
jgi:hypothetical protein